MSDHAHPTFMERVVDNAKAVLTNRRELLNLILAGTVGWTVGEGVEDGWTGDLAVLLVLLVFASVLAADGRARR